jgi:hypothetical protein
MTPAGPPLSWLVLFNFFMVKYLLLEAYQEQSLLKSVGAVIAYGVAAYTKEPSQVIKTVQLKPKIERKPNLL